MSLMNILDGMEDEEGFNIARVDLNQKMIDDKVIPKINTTENLKENNETNLTNNSVEQDEFDPNKMFNIGERNKTYENPFSQEELASLSEKMQERSNPDNAQTLNIPDNKPYEENITGNTSTVVSEDDGLSFEIVNPDSDAQELPGESLFSINAGGLDDTELLGGSLLQSTPSSLTDSTTEQDSPISEEELFTELGKHSVEINAKELAENFNPNAVISETLEDNSIVVEESEPVIVEDSSDEEIMVVEDTHEEAQEYDYIAQMEKNLGKETPPSQDDYYSQEPPLDYNYYENHQPQQPQQNYQQSQQQTNPNTQNQEQPQHNQSVVQTSNTGLPLYATPFGYKLYIPKSNESNFKTTNPYILDFKDAPLSDVEGEVLVTDAKIIPYGTKGDTRVEWDVLTKDLYLTTATQFTLKNEITQEELNPFIGQVVYVSGKVSNYKGTKQLKINLLDKPRNVTVADFQGPVGDMIPVDHEIEVYKDWYRFLTSTMKSHWIPSMLNTVLVRSGNLERMLKASASSSMHDSGVGGLFKHTMKVAMNAYNIAQVYPYLNSDIMIGSALTHDLGKLIEIVNKKYTKEGDLNGHIVIGYSMVRDAINQLTESGVEIDSDEISNLLHCILAHHGQLEWGSPVTPKTREAMAIHLSDMIDARLTHMSETMGDSEKGYSKKLKSSVYDLN